MITEGSSIMIVRIECMYSDDFDCNDYEEEELIRINSDAIRASFMILEDENQIEALNGREGELSTSFEYQFHDGQLCAIIDGEYVPCEDPDALDFYLRNHDTHTMNDADGDIEQKCTGIPQLSTRSIVEEPPHVQIMAEGAPSDTPLKQECFRKLLRHIITEVENLYHYAPSDKVANPLVRAKFELQDALSEAQQGVYWTHVHWGDFEISVDELKHRL